MKIASLIHYCLLYLFTCTGLLQAEGFIAGTLIKTDSGYTRIEQLNIGDSIVSPRQNSTTQKCPISAATCCTIDCCIRVGIGNEYIYTTPDQKFYSYNQQKWIAAATLKATDLLMNCHGKSICIDTIEPIHEQRTMYLLSVETNHTLCVSPYDIIAHNSPEVVLHIFSSITPAIMQTIGAVCATLFGAHIAQKISKKHRLEIMNAASNSNTNSDFGGGGGWQDPEEDDDKNNDNKEHPHGIYEDAGYHHKNSDGTKSPCPKNGQKCLDYSIKAQGRQRIAIEGDTFIMLKYTSPGKYHGHVIEWKEIERPIRTILIRNGFVRKSGKIIKQITKMVLS